MKSIKEWKMAQLLSELELAKDMPEMPDAATGASLRNLRTSLPTNIKVDVSDRTSTLKRAILDIHEKNADNPLETLLDVIGLTFSIVSPQMGTNIGRGEVSKFIADLIKSQAG